MKYFAPISLSQLSRAWDKVWREMETMGFACRRLESCQVWLGWISTAYGYQCFGEREEGKHCGDIVLPSVSLSHFVDYFRGHAFVSSVDVLRHEYGHAYADVNRRRIETQRFEKAFGRPHDVSYGDPADYSPEEHVTAYAATSSGEDFAETFFHYLKHRGNLPRRFDRSGIRRKWRFIEELRK